jgi:prephenate dehydratase
MEIKLFLASKDGKIKNNLYTNHYAYKESEEFIKDLNINKIEFISSTSEAAKFAKEKNSMCICSKLAVENYGLNMIK